MINIQPINSEAAYASALEEIDELFDAVPNTPKGDKLDALTTLVEAYEAIHDPIDTSA